MQLKISGLRPMTLGSFAIAHRRIRCGIIPNGSQPVEDKEIDDQSVM